MSHVHDHEHEVDPLDVAIDPPAEQLLEALRHQWLSDREAYTRLNERFLIAQETVKFQNEIMDQLRGQIRQLEGGKA